MARSGACFQQCAATVNMCASSASCASVNGVSDGRRAVGDARVS